MHYLWGYVRLSTLFFSRVRGYMDKTAAIQLLKSMLPSVSDPEGIESPPRASGRE
jgi:hypothetical protein